MTDQVALEIGLVLAELDSQLKVRETPASPEEAGEILRDIMARRAAKKQEKNSKQGAWQPPGTFPPDVVKKALAKRQENEERIARLTNPKGAPVIFPGYD